MALRKKNLEMTDSGSGSTTKAEDQKKPKTPTVQQTSTNRTNPARTTASAAAQTTTEPEKVRYTKANYRYEATDTGGGYEKNQIANAANQKVTDTPIFRFV